MKSVETEGKTIEEAISRACEELGVSREELDINVLANGSTGFLGLVGARNARIRATLKESPKTPAPEPGPASVSSGDQVAEAARKILSDLLRLLEVEASIDLKEDS